MAARRLVLLLLVLGLLAPADAGAQTRRVADPGGGNPWTASVSTSGAGRTCALVFQGRVRKGTFCARVGDRVPYSYNVRYDTPPDTQRWRSVFVIVMAPTVQTATLTTPEGARRYRRGIGPRVLLAVVAGKVEQPPLVVRARLRGRLVTARGGRPAAAEARDPLGGQAWRTVAERESTRRACVSWERVTPRFGGKEESPSEGRFRCGNPSLNVPAVGVDRVSGRTVVYGLAGRAVRGVLLRGPGEPRIAFDPSSRSFIAVLAGDVAASELTLVLAMSDGRDVERPLG